MKQITNKEYEEWQKYKAEKANGRILLPDTVRFICEANGYDAEKIGQHFLEILPKICCKTQRNLEIPLFQAFFSTYVPEKAFFVCIKDSVFIDPARWEACPHASFFIFLSAEFLLSPSGGNNCK
ncbi:MAG: hypothetical protein IJM71_03570 [Clostridia bacterium]|nr:hypothetical protein [Clostridia bacterium]